VTFHGEFVHLDDIELDVACRKEARNAFYIGATGPKMMALTGKSLTVWC
jgi:5,10-methylenetetrahydromethanopterin reductase